MPAMQVPSPSTWIAPASSTMRRGVAAGADMLEDPARQIGVLGVVGMQLAPAVEGPGDAGHLARRVAEEAGADVAHPAVVVRQRPAW